MIKKLAIVSTIFLLFGCSSGDTEQRQRTPDGTYRPSGFHAFIEHGTSNAPVSLLKADSLYHLFYTTGSDEWGHLSSRDLLSWEPEVSFPIPRDGYGEVVLDPNNLTNLDAPWNIVFSDDDELFLNYSEDGVNWEEYSDAPILQAKGIPSISWNTDLERWILTTTNETEVSVYSSENLIEWTQHFSTPTIQGTRRATLLSTQGKWFIFFQGKTLSYQIGSFDGDTFQSLGDVQRIEGFISDFGTVYKDKEEVTLISKTPTANTQLPSFFTPMALVLSDSGGLNLFPSSHLNAAIVGKRRTKLSRLITDGPSWFNLSIDQSFQKLEIVISDNSSDLKILWDTNTSKISMSGSALMSQNLAEQTMTGSISNENLSVDIIIDHASVDLFFNNGEYSAGILTLPDTFFSKIEVFLDGEKYDARGILYDIGI